MSVSSRTADEAKAHNILVMGQSLGELYTVLWQEVAWLHVKWAEFVTLFGEKQSRIGLLNQVAPMFFRLVQDSLWEDVLLHIACLTDSPQSVGKPNLSIRRFPTIVAAGPLRTKVQDLVDQALMTTEFCRDWRNRHIAHIDLALALGSGATPLQNASREKVRVALEAIDAVMNAISAHYQNSTTHFDPVSQGGSALSLLYVLDDGIQFDVLRRERLKNGGFDLAKDGPRTL